jgi:CRISPR-associated protein Cpf1
MANSTKNSLSRFTNLYSLSKTLRFGLEPEPESQNFIKKLFESNENDETVNDLERAKSYSNVKLLIDCMHREIINNVLKEFCFEEKELKKLNELENEEEEIEQDDSGEDKKDPLKKIREKLSRLLNEQAAVMFNKELINPKKDEKCELEKWLETAANEQLELGNEQVIDREKIKIDIENMRGENGKTFWTYFEGFNENRANIYSKDKISTSIPFRILHDNFPIFQRNIENYRNIEQNYPDLKKLIDEKGASEIFKIDYFNKCLTQAGIDIYNNEKLGIIATRQGEEQDKGINQIINEFVQTKNKEIKSSTSKGEKPKKIKVAVFDKLKKQILSIRKTSSFQFKTFDSTDDIIKGINRAYIEFKELKQQIVDFLSEAEQYDLSEVFLNEKFISILSKKIFKYGRHIEIALKNENIKESKWYSIETIQRVIGDNIVIEYLKNPTMTIFINEDESEERSLFDEIESRAKNIDYILNGSYKKDLKEEKGEDSEKVKSFLDALLEFNYILSSFVSKSKAFYKINKDEEFYNARKQLQEQIWDLEILDLYNQTRNYITKKPYSLDKIRLMFGTPTLLKNWPKYEMGMLLKTDRYYYIAIPKNNKVLRTIIQNPENSSDIISVMDYDQSKAGQLIQNLMVIDGKTVQKKGHKLDLKESKVEYNGREYMGTIDGDNFEVSIDGELLRIKIDKNTVNIELEIQKNINLPTHINEIRKKGSHNVGKNFNKADLVKFIDFYKERINEYKGASFTFKDSKDYENFKEFTDDIDEQSYQMDFKDTSFKHIKSLASNGDIYLFKIHCKDFNDHSKKGGNKNLHTLYWEMLFDEKNLEDVRFKLNGQAQIFVRQAQKLKNNTIHKKGEKIPKKWFEGKPVPGEAIKRLNKYAKESIPLEKWTKGDEIYKDNFVTKQVDIIKDRRFTKDTYLFHCSITINFNPENEKFINNRVLKFLRNNDNVCIIGLDRGERNLIYLTMINKEGRIVDGMQFSLNELNKINYNDLLVSKAISRTEARKNWQTIENIKELKEGYLSLAIHNLANLIVEKNTIIVMENLNYGFKDSRAKIDKGIYQKFESMLIKKLQYLVVNKQNLYEKGGILDAYQLVNEKVPTYKGICLQNGFLFYIPPDYTSKIDPKTGFVNLLDTRFINRDKARDFIKKFDKIYYDKTYKYFRFEFDYKKFNKLRVDVTDLPKTKWSVCSHNATRVIGKQINNKWVREKINVNDKLVELFKSQNLSYENSENIIESICEITDAKFFENLLNYLSVLLALRHTWEDESKVVKDTIVSSVEYEQNKFFNSEDNDEAFPIDADANGAFNIARKGLWLLKRLDELGIDEFNKLKKSKEVTKNGTKKKISQWCNNEDWLQFAQKSKNV